VYSPYAELPRVDEIRIYSDHGVRLLWQVHGRNVYLEPPPRGELVARLARLTEEISPD
jgi:hypothetical protein